MKLAAAEAIASVVSDDELGEDYIIPPSPLHPDVFPKEARAVAEAAMKEGVAGGRKVSGEWVEEHTRRLREFYSTFIEPLNEKRKAFSGRGSSPPRVYRDEKREVLHLKHPHGLRDPPQFIKPVNVNYPLHTLSCQRASPPSGEGKVNGPPNERPDLHAALSYYPPPDAEGQDFIEVSVHPRARRWARRDDFPSVLLSSDHGGAAVVDYCASSSKGSSPLFESSIIFLWAASRAV